MKVSTKASENKSDKYDWTVWYEQVSPGPTFEVIQMWAWSKEEGVEIVNVRLKEEDVPCNKVDNGSVVMFYRKLGENSVKAVVMKQRSLG